MMEIASFSVSIAAAATSEYGENEMASRSECSVRMAPWSYRSAV
jgi:hypothetical protein